MDKKTIQGLLQWFYNNDRNQPTGGEKLAWRKIKSSQTPHDPWVVLVSEVMLQQTTVATIGKKFPPFIAQFPTPAAMVEAGIDKVLDAWAGLGYYRRAHNLFAAATMIVVEWQGQWPVAFGKMEQVQSPVQSQSQSQSQPPVQSQSQSQPQEQVPRMIAKLKQLPGVGDYTARAIAALAWQTKTIPLDGNIIRVLSRWLKKDISQTRVPTIKKLLAGLDEMILPTASLPKDFMMSDWVQAMMDLANLLCKPTNPSCNACPLQKTCLGKKHWQIYPAPKIKKTKPIFYGAVLIGQNNRGEYLLERRPSDVQRNSRDGNHQGLYQGLLSFPMTALVKDKKKLSHAIKQQLAGKKTTITKTIKKPITKTMKKDCVVHDLTHRRLILSLVFYRPTAPIVDGNFWIANGELASLPLPSVMKKVIKQVAI